MQIVKGWLDGQDNMQECVFDVAWSDPSFGPTLNAFYYVRVHEIPTLRWPAYDALRFGVKMFHSVRMKDQERACTSPIWYNPKG